MTASRSFQQLVFAGVLFLVLSVWAWRQLDERPVNALGWGSDWSSWETWLRPLGNQAARGQVGVNLGDLQDVYFVDSQRGWAVGDDGTILATINGGRDWLPQTSGVTVTLLSVQFSDAQHGWAVGDKGTILVTANGGQDWYAQTSGVMVGLYSVWFSDAQHGWMVGSGGTILATFNGGQDWHAQTSGVTALLFSIRFNDAQHGWAVGRDGTILTTSSGGQDWHAQAGGMGVALLSVQFSDAQHGWVVGAKGTILVTANGGKNWSTQTSEVTVELTSVQFSDPQHGWAVGEKGTILATVNGGQDWYAQTSGVTVELISVQFSDAQHGWVVGRDGTILTTANGGQDWQTQASGAATNLYSVHFSGVQQGWAVGEGGTIFSTANGGQDWQAQTSGVRAWLRSVSFSDAQHGWAVGEKGTILATANGGQDWHAQASGVVEWLYAVHFNDAQHGWAVGGSGTILATANGGQDWYAQASGAKAGLYSVHFSDVQNGWAVGEGGTILATANGGQDWHPQTSGVAVWLSCVRFSDAQRGWAVGIDGTILGTVNGGQEWQTQASRVMVWLKSVYYSDTQHGWTMGEQGTILTDANGEQDWQAQTSGVTTWLESTYFSDAQHGWAVGWNGTILATANGGKTWQKTLLPPKVFAEGRPKLATYPSPLALVALLFSLLFLIHSLHAYYGKPHLLQGGISDAPIDDSADDLLGRTALAKTLADLIRNRDTVPPLAVAVTAPWGSGKSSLLGLLKQELRGEVYPVWLNAWHYQNDSQLLAALMEHVRDQALPPLLSVDNVLFRVRLLAWRCPWRGLGVLVGAAVAAGYWGYGEDWRGYDGWLAAKSSPYLAVVKDSLLWPVAAVVLGVLAAYAVLKMAYSALAAFSPELVAVAGKWGQATGEAVQVADWSKDAGLRFRFGQDFEAVAHALGKGRLLLLIDDLDRCEPKQIETVMRTLNFLFATPAPCYAVVAMDWIYVINALGLAFKDLAKASHKTNEVFASQYVQKIIQIRVDLPTVDAGEVALVDRSAAGGVVVDWWLKAVGRWPWLGTRAVVRWLAKGVVCGPWRWLEAVAWWGWQGGKGVDRKAFYPLYDGVLMLAVAVFLGWGAVQVAGLGQTVLVGSGQVASASALGGVPSAAVDVGVGVREDRLGRAEVTSAGVVPVTMVDEPREPTDWWLFWGLVAVLVLLAVRVWLLLGRVRDTAVFRQVLMVWRADLAARHETPRDWKRLLNRARLFAMRIRVAQERPWYAGLDRAWGAGRWQIPPVVAEPLVVPEALALHLLLLDVHSGGKLLKDVRVLLAQDDDVCWLALVSAHQADIDRFVELKAFFAALDPAGGRLAVGRVAAWGELVAWERLYGGLNF